MKRLLALALLAALPGVSLAASPKIASLDTAGYPTVRLTVVTPKPVGSAPTVTENGRPVVGFRAVNLGREKRRHAPLRPLAVDDRAGDRGRLGGRAPVRRSKPARDRIAVVAVGKKAVQLTSFSTNAAEADGALRTIEVDKVRGTALYDGILVSTQALAADINPTRVLILLTDGQEVSSDQPRAGDRRRARRPGRRLRDRDRKPEPAGPLQRLAEKTGGRYVGASGTKDRRQSTQRWPRSCGARGSSATSLARPGDPIEVVAAGVRAESIVPGVRVVSNAESSKLRTSSSQSARRRRHDRRLPRPDRAPAEGAHRPRLRRQITPHLGEQERKHARRQTQERFTTASSLLKATEKAFGHLRAWHAPPQAARASRPGPLRPVELSTSRPGRASSPACSSPSPAMSTFVTLLAMAVGGHCRSSSCGTRRRRLAAIDEQLLDLLVTLAALKAGHSFQAIQAVVDEKQPPASARSSSACSRRRVSAARWTTPSRRWRADRLEERPRHSP